MAAPASPATGLAARLRALATNPAPSAWSWGCAVVVSLALEYVTAAVGFARLGRGASFRLL